MSGALIDDVMAETGASRDEAVTIARAMIGAESETVILPELERDTVNLALAAAGQWRFVPLGFGGARPVAFDFGAVDKVARWNRIEPSPFRFAGLAIIEREALKAMRTT